MFALAWRGENERTGGKGQFNTNTNEFIRKMILIRNVTTPIATALRFVSQQTDTDVEANSGHILAEIMEVLL